MKFHMVLLSPIAPGTALWWFQFYQNHLPSYLSWQNWTWHIIFSKFKNQQNCCCSHFRHHHLGYSTPMAHHCTLWCQTPSDHMVQTRAITSPNRPSPDHCLQSILNAAVDVSTSAWKGFNEDSFCWEFLASCLCWHTDWQAARMVQHHATRLLDKHAPCRTARLRCQPTTHWFDANCANTKRHTRAFERLYRRTKLDSDWLVWIGQALRKQQLFAAKQNQFWEKKISDSKGDPKKLWRHLSGVLRNVISKPPTSGKLTAERFSDAFQEKLTGMWSETGSAAPPVFNRPPCAFNMLGFEPIDAVAVQRLISNAACKSSEFDPVPTWIIQKFAVELSPFIAALFNASMSGGYFPASQKTASITLILKKASLDPLNIGTTFFSKLLECAAYEQIVGYMECHHLLLQLQSAYQKHRFTETAIIKVMSDIYRAADAGLVTLLGLLDLSKSHWHLGAVRFQHARYCWCLTGLQACQTARSCSPSYADVHVRWDRQGLDEF